MSATSIRYLKRGRLLLDPPGRLVYHRPGRLAWDPQPGMERHWTACGRLIYATDHKSHVSIREYDGVRLDNAQLVARPCHRCWP